MSHTVWWWRHAKEENLQIRPIKRSVLKLSKGPFFEAFEIEWETRTHAHSMYRGSYELALVSEKERKKREEELWDRWTLRKCCVFVFVLFPTSYINPLLFFFFFFFFKLIIGNFLNISNILSISYMQIQNAQILIRVSTINQSTKKNPTLIIYTALLQTLIISQFYQVLVFMCLWFFFNVYFSFVILLVFLAFFWLK